MGWEEVCARKQRQLEGRIPEKWLLPDPIPAEITDVRDVPRTCGLLDELELEITELDSATELVERIRGGRYTSVQVATAYLKRAMIAQQLVNCLTEFWIDDALEQAAALDKAFKQTGPVGPLHGLPISLKVQFHVKDKELNMGIVAWIGRISPADAALVTLLRRAGAVVYVRTNVCQTLMMPETNNRVYGRTVNPYNRGLTPGGSSGGEGALVALKGSPLGVGTDIGGSVRIPASLNGLYGLRPTSRRVPYGGAANTLLGGEGVESSIGPLARSLDGCALFMQAIALGNPCDLDPHVVKPDWDEGALRLDHLPDKGKTLTFGYYTDNDHVRALPPVRRAMQATIDAVKAQGHKVIPWTPVGHGEMIDLARQIFSAGGAEDFRVTLGDEPRVPGINMRDDPGLTVWQYWQLAVRRNAYRDAFLKQWLETASVTGSGRPIDGLICPVAPWPASPSGTNSYAGYTLVYNVLDVPSVTIPVTFADPAVDLCEEDFVPKNEVEEAYYKVYDPVKFADSPVGIQVVGRRWREDELLGVARKVDEALEGDRRGS